MENTFFNRYLIAPCGMNCALCRAYLRDKNKCCGCRSNEIPFKSCSDCTIRNCEILVERNLVFCSEECRKYPCQRLKNLDKRYRTKYMMSMIENLEFIYKNGIDKFIEHEKQRWIKEDQVFCVHNKMYYDMKD